MYFIDNENYSLMLSICRNYYTSGKSRVKRNKFYLRTRAEYPENFYNLEVWWLWFVFKIKFN